jgi:hypothetical protein
MMSSLNSQLSSESIVHKPFRHRGNHKHLREGFVDHKMMPVDAKQTLTTSHQEWTADQDLSPIHPRSDGEGARISGKHAPP